MASQLEILLVARDAGMTAAFNAAGKSAQAMGNEIDKASAKVEQAGTRASKFGDAANKIDTAGRNARIGLASMSQAAGLLGSNVSSVIAPIMGAADAIGDLAGAAASFGLIGIGVAAAVVAIGVLNQQYKAQHDALVYVIRAQDEYIAKLAEFTTTSAAAAAKVEELVQAMAHLREAEAGGGGGAFNAASVVYFTRVIAELKAELDSLRGDQAYTALENLRASSDHAATSAYAHAQAERERKIAMDSAASATQQLAADTDAYYNTLVKVQGATNTAFYNFVQTNHAMVGQTSALDANATRWEAYNKLIGQRFPVSVGAAQSAYEKWKKSLSDTSGYDKAKAALEAMNAKLKGLVEGALNPTTVEQRLGMAGDAWDEFRLRLEAVATGTDPSQYGEEFVKQMDALGMSAAQAAEAFKNFSLFANPENIKLVNMGPIIESVKQQLDSMIGKANLTSAAMAEVWKNLSPQQKAALGAQGINNTAEAVEALLDPAGKAKTEVEGLGNAISNIPRSIVSTFTVVKDAATLAIEEFRTVLDQFIADYGGITIHIDAEANATPPTAGAGAAPPTPPGGAGTGGTPFATGLDWTVPGGFPNDTYPFRGNLTSGEHVRITPAGQSGGNSGGGNVIYISIDGSPFRRVSDRRIANMAALGQGA